jgi:hypothetical protein
MFVSSGSDIFPPHMIPTVTESSLAILALRAEVSDLKLQNSVLTSENKRLEVELRVEGQRRDERMKILFSSSGHHGYNGHLTRSASARVSNAVAGPSRITNHSAGKPKTQKQRGSDKKDGHRRAPEEPAKTIPRHFKCRICMEEHVEESIARIESCGHSFCRECVREYVGFKLDENRFPILCPECMTEERKGEPGGV